MANFLDPQTLAKADAARFNASGERTTLDAIRKALRGGPLVGDPVGIAKAAKGAKPSRAQDPNADDAYDIDKDEDEDEDMCLTTTERNDLRARRKARKAADKKRGNVDAARRTIKALHAAGPTPFDPDLFRKLADPNEREEYTDNRASVKLIKQAQRRPLSMHPSANVPIDEADIQAIIARGKQQMRKGRPALPANSANAAWGDAVADTGAVNNWDDENTQRPGVERVGGFSDSTIGPNDSRIRAAVNASGSSNRDAAVSAIQMDWKRKKEQMASSFAARPAARTGDDAMKSVLLRDLGRRVGDDLRKAFAR